MKALPIAISLAVLAVPLFASAGDDQAKKSSTSATTLSAEPQQQAVDSPLVRAAKATGRLNKKPTMVITNEMLAKAGGHLTTTTLNTPLPPAPPSVSNAQAQAVAAQKQRLDVIEKAKKAEAAKKAQAARNAAADIYGENAEERIDDPATQERVMQQSTSTQAPPESKKPPLE